MKVRRCPHRWDVSPRRAMAIQSALADQIVMTPAPKPLQLIAGADIAFSRDGRDAIAAVVVWDVTQRRVVETQHARHPVRFPYVPGLLSFREAPALLKTIRKLRTTPDAFLFDGQGYAHPRRMGLACHVGLIIDRPSAGCGKSRLIGTHEEPKLDRGARSALMHDGERIGTVLRTRQKVKCVYVSVGHRMTLRQAVDLVLACGNGYRLPEPTRLADQLVARIKRESP